MISHFIRVAVLMCLAFTVAGQDFAYSIRNYKAVDGLPQSQVNIMLEDDNGYLWIGTHGGGLARFDGREFKVYTTLDGLLSNIVTYLKMDSRQNLWIVHPRGVTRFDGAHFKKFAQPGAPGNVRRIRKAFEFQDTIFFLAVPGHLGKIYNDSLYYWSEPREKDPLINYCHITPDKQVLLYRSDSTFLLMTAAGNVIFSHKEKFNRLFSIFNYRNQIWVNTDQGRFTVNLAARDFVPAVLGIQNHILYQDGVNDVFWTRHNNSLLKEKLVDGKTRTDTVLKDVELNQVMVDSEGNTWFATHGMGLYKYFIQDFDRVTPAHINVVMAVHRDSEGVIWAGSSTKGLWSIRDGKVRSYASKTNSYRNEIHAIAEGPDKTVWVGTSDGLARYNRETDDFTWFTRGEGLSSGMVSQIEFDDKGNLYAGTFSGGLNYFDGKAFSHITMEDGLNSNNVSAAYYSEFHKKLFIGNELGMLSVTPPRNVETIFIPEIRNASVISLHGLRDSLVLVGTAGAGVAIYHPGNRFNKMITTHHGLTSDFIYFSAADKDGFLWIGTEKGITRLKLNTDLDIIENLHYDFDNGLAGVETNQNSFFLGDDKKYFGLLDGIYQFNDLPRDERRSFGLHLTGLELFYGQYAPGDYASRHTGFFRLPLEPEFPPEINHVTFHYNRVDKRYPKSVKFRYFLENFDKTWSQPSSNNEVTYSNLPPGNYVFKVMATDNLGSWSPDYVTYPFVVQTPFYRTPAFVAGVVVLLAGLITLALYIRVKNKVDKVVMTERIRLREQELLRKEIARDFHDEMGNQLTRIINYVSLLKLNGSANGSHADLYSKVEDSAKYLYTGTRDFIWSIDPGNDELSKLFLHIRDFGEKLFEEKHISFRAFNEVKEAFKLPYGFSREANLIFKEAMTNAFKYSGAANVSLTLRRDLGDFEMSFEDDGVGFYAGDIEKSNGLKNIRERADRINAVLRIQSTRNKGTKIVLSFKLDKSLKYGLSI